MVNAVFLGTGFGGGGAERHFSRLVPGLLPGAMRRTVLSLAPFEKDDAIRGIECRHLGFRSWRDYPAAIGRLVRIFDEEAVDLVYSISRCPNAVGTAAAAMARRRPVVVLGENTRPLEAFVFSPRAIDLAWLAVQANCFRRADMVICNSSSACSEVVDHFGAVPDRVRLARNPLPARARQEPCVGPASTSRRCDVLTAARLVEGKGLEDLIEAWARMRRPEGRLVILGDGPLRGPLQVLSGRLGVAGTTSFPGWVDDPGPWIDQATVVVLASYWEGLPNLVLEAMEAGAAVVATRSTSWIVEFEKAGGVAGVAVGDVRGLAEAISGLLGSAERRRRLQVAGKKLAAGFRVEEVAAERSRLLEEAWSQSGNRGGRS